MISVPGAGHARPLQGIFLPVATPFDRSGGLYHAKLKHNIEKWNPLSLSGYVVCGPAGESASLTGEEKVTLWEWAAKYAAPEKLLIAGVGAEGVRETVLLVNQAASLGCRFALVTTHPSLQREVADEARIPLIVREQPEGDPPHPNIAAVLEDSGDPERVLALKPRFKVLTGSEAALWPCLSAGAAGAILPYANAAPYSVIAIWEAHRGRHTETGLDWQERISHAARLVTAKHGVPGLKHAMDLNGYYGGPCRPPSAPLTPEARREIEEAFRELRG